MSKTLEELGYEKDYEDEYILEYHNAETETIICFAKSGHGFYCKDEYGGSQIVTTNELKAIYKYCEDNKWI